jgi:hypothetical protein
VQLELALLLKIIRNFEREPAQDLYKYTAIKNG